MATMPALIASGRSGQASITRRRAAESGDDTAKSGGESGVRVDRPPCDV
jgi:hypothetical protein